MNSLFLSHCSDDTAIMDQICSSLPEIFGSDTQKIFCTYQNGILPGMDRGPYIAKKLNSYNTMIAIITNCYLRSVICISELASFWAKGGNVLPIIYNGETGVNFIKQLFGKDLIYVSSNNKNNGDLVRWLEQSLGVAAEKAELAKRWLDAEQSDPDHLTNRTDGTTWRPFIGGDDQYKNYIHYCNASGIRKIRNTPLSSDELRRNLVNKKEVYLLGTNNSSVVLANISLFSEVLRNGNNLYVLLANNDSQFCQDVAAIESCPSIYDSMEQFEKEVKREKERLHNAFGMVKDQLRSIYRNAMKDCHKQNKPIGHLYLGCAFTLVRQTVIMGLDPEQNKLWAWMTLTMPPKRASSGTISMEVCGAMNDGNSEYRTLTENIEEYVTEICELANKYGQFYEITLNSALPDYFKEFGNLEAAKSEWSNYYNNAKNNMKKHKGCSRELIEIAAQHPLHNGTEPDTVFKARLDAGIMIYENLKQSGKSPAIYVPGDIHIPDQCALSEAGIQYILSTGRVPADDLFGEEMNRKYKGEHGVYNSADECFTAARIFLDGDFCQLHCVCSDSQAQRKKLFYWRFGVIPMIHTVPNDMFHDDFNETFDAVPNVIFRDPDWQDPNSYDYRRTRSNRKAGFPFV